MVKLNPLCLPKYELDHEVNFWKTLFQSIINVNYVENGMLEQMHYKIQTFNFNAIQRMCFCQTHLQLTSMEYEAMKFAMAKLKNKSGNEEMKKSLIRINE